MTPETLDALGADLEPVNLREVIPEAAKKVAQFYCRPKNLAGLTGATLLPMVVFQRKTPLLPWAIVAAAGWFAGQATWQATRDLHDIAQAARDSA